MVTLFVLFDFSRAFDTVNHSLLVDKLQSFELSNQVIRWLISYLTGRSQAVVGPDGGMYAWMAVLAGVPQGSVLGPLLFSLFINDLPTVLSYSKYILYADELQIYLHCYSEELPDAIVRLSSDISRVCGWATRSQLKLNLNKTKAVCIASGQFIRHLDLDSVGGIR